jgi:hypothetical protein
VKKLGIILAIAVAVAAVPLVAMAWQGPDPVSGSSWNRHMGPSQPVSGSLGWGRMRWGHNWESHHKAGGGAPVDRSAQQRVGDAPMYLMDTPPASGVPGYGPGGCPMWDGTTYPPDQTSEWYPGHGRGRNGPGWGRGMMGGGW